jgi:hypothetical protein
MQNSQDFRLQIAILEKRNETGQGGPCAPRELVTVSQKCRFSPTINQEKTRRKNIVHSSVRGVLNGERKGLKNVFTGKETVACGDTAH